MKIPVCSELSRRARKLLTIPLGLLFFPLASLPVLAVIPNGGNGGDCVNTPIGCIPTEGGAFARWILGVGIELGILVAALLIIIGGFQVVSSTGDPERLADAKSRITAAVAGLLFILFSVIILRIIGVEIIGISL